MEQNKHGHTRQTHNEKVGEYDVAGSVKRPKNKQKTKPRQDKQINAGLEGKRTAKTQANTMLLALRSD